LTGTNLLPQVLEMLASQIRSSYAAAFSLAPSGSPKRHKIQVALKNKKLGKIEAGDRNLIY